MGLIDRVERPVPLTAMHDLQKFYCGEAMLDDWLRQRALKNAELGATRTYVVCAPDTNQVIGFYALCMGQTFNHEVPGAMRRNMPNQIPVVILARLATDLNWQGHGLGEALLDDAVRRALRASEQVAARLLIVHAISAKATSFYKRHGFVILPVESATLALDLLRLPRQQANS